MIIRYRVLQVYIEPIFRHTESRYLLKHAHSIAEFFLEKGSFSKSSIVILYTARGLPSDIITLSTKLVPQKLPRVLKARGQKIALIHPSEMNINTYPPK